MRRALLLLSLSCWLALAAGAAANGADAAAGEAPAGHLLVVHKESVHVTIDLERGAGDAAVLVGHFVPDEPNLHLYGIDLPADADGGVPSCIALPPDGPVCATGPLEADQKSHKHDDLLIYNPGPITLTLPIRLPHSADGAQVPAKVILSWMACGPDFCKNPVIKMAFPVMVPSVAEAEAHLTHGGAATSAAPALDTAELQRAVRAAVSEALMRQAEEGHGVAWERPDSKDAVLALEAQSRVHGQSVLLDFTGPSCNNCQVMEKTVFRRAEVLKAVRDLVAISCNTDPPHEDLAQWEQDAFKTENRPLYVRIDPQGRQVRWSKVFSPDDRATMGQFIAFLSGGAGSDAAGDPGASSSFWLLAIIGGLVTLVMPCTYPMIPFTINVFAKQAAAGTRLLPLAAFYAAGIVGCFVGLGVLITGVFGTQLSILAGHPLTNLIIASVFILFGLSLLGVFFLRLPASLNNAIGGARGGYLGALLMGLTFAATAFSCTAPFAGTVLAEAVTTGSWHKAVAGMAVYGATIAIPFFALAMSPSALKRLPRAGAWMNEFKIVGGLVELAAALKFLAICDNAWGWGVFGRSSCLTAWSACALLSGTYIMGLWRWQGDQRVEGVTFPRLALSGIFLALGLWFLAGLCGHDLGLIEGFFPGDPAPG